MTHVSESHLMNKLNFKEYKCCNVCHMDEQQGRPIINLDFYDLVGILTLKEYTTVCCRVWKKIQFQHMAKTNRVVNNGYLPDRREGW